MKRNKRCRILVNTEDSLLSHMCTQIEKTHSVTVLEEADQGVVMVRMKDSAQNGPFLLGEVLVTEAKVLINDTVGIGIIKGHHPRKAYQLALIDAAYNTSSPLIEDWNDLLLIEEERQLMEAEKVNARFERTKVDFSTMEDQGVSK